MAATGFTPISLYYTTTAAAQPVDTKLVAGELALNTTDGKLYFKNTGGIVTLLASADGSIGNVVGPSSATDNALARFDTTTGKLIQNSIAILTDAGALSGLTGLASTSATISGLTSGRVTYAGTAGLLQDSANLTFNGTTLTSTGFAGPLTGAVTGNASTATALQTSRTIFGQSFDGTANVTGSVTSSALTSGRVTYATTSGLLTDSANLTFNGTTLTTLNSAYTGTLTGGTGIVNLGSGQFYKDASGNIGVGTSSPYKHLSVTQASSTSYSTSDFDQDYLALQVANTTNDKATGIYFAVGSNGEAAISAVETSDAETALTFGTRGGGSRPERMRIDSSGNVGIGTSSPSSPLDVVGNTFGVGLRIRGRASDNVGYLNFVSNAGSDYSYIGTPVANALAFYTNGYSERMRIDSSGRVLVGLTSANASGSNFQVSQGITFPATQSASSDAKTLDDYEEGTWTPVINGTTMASGSGWYKKIGSQVFCGFNNLAGVAAVANNADAPITGAPFALTSYTQGGAISVNFNDASDSYKSALLVGRTTNTKIEFTNRSGVATTTDDPFNMVASYQVL